MVCMEKIFGDDTNYCNKCRSLKDPTSDKCSTCELTILPNKRETIYRIANKLGNNKKELKEEQIEDVYNVKPTEKVETTVILGSHVFKPKKRTITHSIGHRVNIHNDLMDFLLEYNDEISYINHDGSYYGIAFRDKPERELLLYTNIWYKIEEILDKYDS